MKYVMFKMKRKLLIEHVPIIFPNNLVHDEIAEAMTIGVLAGFDVHSAGEWIMLSNTACGGSSTLRISSDPADTNRIRMADYGALLT